MAGTKSEALRVLGERRRVRRMQRSLWESARLMSPVDGFRQHAAFVTLTYRPGASWRARHISEFRERARQYLPAGTAFKWIWRAELQARGAVHYHALVWLPSGVRLPKPDRCGWWPHGSSQIEGAKSLGPGYLTKYMQKSSAAPTPLPKGARIFGIAGLTSSSRASLRSVLLPRYVRDVVGQGGAVRVAGGGWCGLETGEWFPAWRLLWFDGGLWGQPP